MRADVSEWNCPKETAVSAVSGRSGDIVDKLPLYVKALTYKSYSLESKIPSIFCNILIK